MSIITLRLKDKKYAPWGLLTDEPQPRTIIWLTELEPEGYIDSETLTDWDISRIIQSVNQEVITQSGLFLPEPESKQNVLDSSDLSNIVSSINANVASKIMPSAEVIDVTNLLKEQINNSEETVMRVQDGYPEVDNILKLPANQLKKRLKKMAKKSFSISFFKNCKKREEEKKNRKTIIAILIRIIQAKIAAIEVDRRFDSYSGQTTLSDQYYDMIEEDID
jgi:hypothetical protein